VTVRVSTLKGTGAGRYYTEHLPSYYLDGDEPPGRWWGRGADRLGLSGEIDPEAFLAVMAGHDPTTGRNLGRRMGEGSVRGYDATFSAPKSVSVMFALGNPDVRRQAVEAHERAVYAVLGWVETHAHTRMRRRGHIVCVDAEGIVVGVFRQHISRKLDPQLHTHAVIANRVRAPDGRWLALDARTIKVDQRTLSALYHATLRSELTRRLGVRWELPEHGIAEIADIDPEILAAFSQRTTDLQRRLNLKLTRFHADLARSPSPSERWRLEREAAIDSRPAKPHGTSAAELRQEWQDRVRALGWDPLRIIKAVIGRQRGLEGIDAATAARLAKQALDSLAERQSTWRPAELIRELASATPPTITADAGELTGFLQQLADHATTTRCVDVSRLIPAGVALRRDGRPISESAMDRALTTEGILDEEEQLIAWAERRRDGHAPARPVHHERQLTPIQAEVAAVVAGHGELELIVGPAGSGKTTTLASAVTELRAQDRPVFGVAPTAAAADVLAVETGMGADTLDKLLTEHRHPARPPDSAYDLPKGTTVIVDEAGTAATPKLADLARLADQREWRVVLVGDPRQFSAVGRGGMFAHLVDGYGCVELNQVHRFRHDWERQASLRLRNGDAAVLAEYDRRDRLHDGTLSQMEEEVITAWCQARSRGETVALMANGTDTVARLNRLAQETRIASGELCKDNPHNRIIFVPALQIDLSRH